MAPSSYLALLLGPLGIGLAACGAPQDPAHVLPGIDVLVAEGFARLEGRRVALLTHDAARDRSGRRTIDVLSAAPNVELVRILSPEHGLASRAEGDVGDALDEATGLAIGSLYGETRRPTEAMLEGVDALVVDLQDAGVRFYTYATTLGYAMEEAGRRGVPVVVLDRPNPLGGELVDGPSADPDRLRFICYRPIPLVHGLTMGELARLYVHSFGVHCELDVVACAGWRRAMRWDDTGLTWVAPSPNLRTSVEALLYPALGLLEATNVSVGRGTDTPFELLGAPWIDGGRLADVLAEDVLPGIALRPASFTPRAGPFAGERCEGVHLAVLDGSSLQPVRSGLTIAWRLEQLFPEAFDQEHVLERLDAADVAQRLVTIDEPAHLAEVWADDVRAFRERRAPILLYR